MAVNISSEFDTVLFDVFFLLGGELLKNPRSEKCHISDEHVLRAQIREYPWFPLKGFVHLSYFNMFYEFCIFITKI